MHKTLIIIRREYLTRVRKKSFILLTLFMPFLFAFIGIVPFILGKINGDEQKKIVIIDKTGKYAPHFQTDDRFCFVQDTQMRPTYKSDTTDVEAVLFITQSLTQNPKAATLYGRKEIQTALQQQIEKVLSEQFRKEKLSSYNIPQLSQIIEEVDQPLTLTTVKWDKSGNETFSSSAIALTAGFIFTFLIYMFVLAYGGMVMQSVLEEKTNRIMEIMVSSVKPFQLMMGKIIGVALVGFTQILVWAVLLISLFVIVIPLFISDFSTTSAIATPGIPGAAETLAQASSNDSVAILTAILHLPFLEMGIMFILYFIGGYLLFASFFAAVGASVNSQEDSSQFTTPVIIVLIFGMYAAIGSAENIEK